MASADDALNRLMLIGCSISGGIAACYLKLRFPDLEIISIQKPGAKFPVVGESLTEFSTLMLHELGLASYLETHQFHKYGLTFYFKEKIDDPASYVYATHEAMRIPPMPSNQVNRFTLAVRLRQRAEQLGVTMIDGAVKDVSISQGDLNQVLYVPEGGEPVRIDARWIVDASGRSRVLANKLGLRRTSRYQRSSFWFRLEGFDKDILKQMQEVKTPHHCFDPYYVTHHFLGKHNWIWAIPMRSEDGERLISIGIVYRPDLYKGEVTSVEAFMTNVGAEHPVVAKLVESGRIVDTNVFRNYFYETERSYSRDGWFIIGDAGDTVDPLYSTGIATTSLQVKQVAALIEADRNGTLSDQFVLDLETLYKTIRNSLQTEISTLYEVIDDPFQSHVRVHCASAFYFYILLPAYLCGYITDRVGAPLLTRAIRESVGKFESLKSLLAVASRRLGPLSAGEVTNLYDQSVNWKLSGPAEQTMPRDLAKVSLFFAKVRFRVLRKAGWHHWTRHIPLCLKDLAKAFVFGVLLRHRSLRQLRIARWIAGPGARSAENRRGDRQPAQALAATAFRRAR
jgi:flavin-dependent dehydrogenase